MRSSHHRNHKQRTVSYSYSCLWREILECVGYVTFIVECQMHYEVMNYHVQCFLIQRSVFLDQRHFERDTQAEKSRGIFVVSPLHVAEAQPRVFTFSSPVLSYLPTQGIFGRLLAWLCLYILRSLVFQASANPAPPAASVPAVAVPVLSAPQAPPAQPAGAVAGQQKQFNEVYQSSVRFSFHSSVLFTQVLRRFAFYPGVTYVHRVSALAKHSAARVSSTFLVCRVSALAKRLLMCQAQIGFAVCRPWLNVRSCVKLKLVLPCVSSG